MTRRLTASFATGAIAAMWLLVTAGPAMAACHVAAFVESSVQVAESDGVASLVVELQGRQPSCAGTVDVSTVDGTAVAGEDYEAVTQTLTFEEGDDRVETVEIPILADDEADGGEAFTVELSNPTGSIGNTGGPATVTITDDAGESEAEPTAPATVEEDSADGAQDDPVDGAQEGVDAEGGAGEPADEGGDLGIILAVVAAIAIGGGAFVLLRGRG
jgi:hypothetical protein